MRRTSASFLLGFLSLSDAFTPAWTIDKYLNNACPKSLKSTSTLFQTPVSKNQQWDVDLYQKHSFVFEYGSSLVDVLDAQPGEVILDVGCGSGQLTRKIADRGAAAIGFDADVNMVERAQNEYPDLSFFQADVTTLEMPTSTTLPTAVDAIFSNAALHWVKNADAAVASMAKVLKPGGRFVVELGGKGNVDRIFRASQAILGKQPGAPHQDNPWYFPSVAEYSSLLERHGIEVLSADLYDRPTLLEEGKDGMTNWLRMFGGILLQDVPEESKDQVIEDIVSKLRDEDNSLFDGEIWTADYRRLRIVGRKFSSVL
mmetsp:Transcript_5891/g.16210  ORF Transcript_5891/g.16210 Transcript_5891/m.16210 type:complete len:314 (+) Transcript_5891:107-1048(+)